MSEFEEELPTDPPEEIEPTEPTEPTDPPIEEPEIPIFEPPTPQTDKLLLFEDSTYETGYWLSPESYPDKVCYLVDEGSEEGKTLSTKIQALYPYFTIEVEEGELLDVVEREKTQEEIDAENAPPPKTADQIKIEQLEDESVSNMMALAEVFETTERLNGVREQETVETMLGLAEAYGLILEQQELIMTMADRIEALEAAQEGNKLWQLFTRT